MVMILVAKYVMPLVIISRLIDVCERVPTM
jgi:hypothetical protein